MRARRAGGRPGRLTTTVAALVVTVMAGGCGMFSPADDDDAGVDLSSAEPLPIPEEVAADGGCAGANTEPSDLAATRQVARCASGLPAAQPLAQPVTVRVGVRALTEEVAPILLADHFAEFAAEGITVEISEFASAEDLYEALDTGAVDVAAGDLDAPFFDRASQERGARVVLGGPIARHAHDTDTPQAGLWLRTDILEKPENWIDLEGGTMPVAVPDSIGDAAAYPINFVLQQDDISLNELVLAVDGGEEAAQRLLDGDYIGAWLSEPYWQPVAESDQPIELVATPPVSESLGGVVYAARLVDPLRDRPVGLAFARAVIRTINTYLAGDYQEDADVVEALAEVTGLGEEEIVDTPAWVFDWELRQGTTIRIQDALILLGGVIYEDAEPEQKLIDRTVYQEVVGAVGAGTG